MYGFSDDGQKWKTLRLLDELVGECVIPWMCAGDFNEILFDHEKMGRSLRREDRMKDFRHCLV